MTTVFHVSDLHFGRPAVPAQIDERAAFEAIDPAKAGAAETSLPVVSVPTTYSGAEWTDFFGVRDPGRRQRGGGAGEDERSSVDSAHADSFLQTEAPTGGCRNEARSLPFIDGHGTPDYD